MFEKLPKDVFITEVGPRDGLQNEKMTVVTTDKVHFIELLAKSGLRQIEATSFVRKESIKQLADASELYPLLLKKLQGHNVDLPCLVPNLKGYEEAKKVGVRSIALFSATSDLFTQKNINATVDESFIRMQSVASLAKQDGIKLRGYISTAFGCPYGGKTGIDELVKVAKRFFGLGVTEISIGDTIGVATPIQVKQYIDVLKKEFDLNQVAMHFHDTRGNAVANCLVSLEMGITRFDSSAAGLGGCPYATGASGNVATEELVSLFDSLGVKSGVDLSKLLKASEFIIEKVGHHSTSKLYQALKAPRS